MSGRFTEPLKCTLLGGTAVSRFLVGGPLIIPDLRPARCAADVGMELEGETQLERLQVDSSFALDAVVARVRTHGGELVGEIAHHNDIPGSSPAGP